jgi:hypothetical protein
MHSGMTVDLQRLRKTFVNVLSVAEEFEQEWRKLFQSAQ